MGNPPNRKDHYVPQGYLRGFLHPRLARNAARLWVLDVSRRRWTPKFTSQIGWQRGFYDYSPQVTAQATADEAFLRLENGFPAVLEQIRNDGPESWPRHREFLIAFAAMLASRSRLFRTQSLARVLPSLGSDADAAALAKNFSITTMQLEMQTRVTDWSGFDWVLAYTADPARPFVTSDQPVGMRGAAQEQTQAHAGKDFWLWCPLSWDLCLVASSQRLTSGLTNALAPQHILELQHHMRQQANIFLVSPVELPDLC